MADKISIPIIDLFAGPGGLGEGFCAFEQNGVQPFRIGLSVEKDSYAHKTLRLRSFFRQFPKGEVPELYYDLLQQKISQHDFPDRLKQHSQLFAAWERASSEAMCEELGAAAHKTISERITNVLGNKRKPWVLIGGPPCQAYSLAGRVRNQGISNYKIEEDSRSTLYLEYLRILAEHQPDIFVMENVKGMLSATLEKKRIFDQILADLQSPSGQESRLRYQIVPIISQAETNGYDEDDPRRFIVKCENFGVPQQRHRVILIGIRDNLGDVELPTLCPQAAPTVKSMLDRLPRLRSGLSRKKSEGRYVKISDTPDTWMTSIRQQLGVNGAPAISSWLNGLDEKVYSKILSVVENFKLPQKDRGAEFVTAKATMDKSHRLFDWFVDERLPGVCNHSTRAHLESDLARYLYCAAFAECHDHSPRLHEFPEALLPEHLNAKSGNFNDRFRVQVANQPATTITSHISKDGHYFIHYDPSLTIGNLILAS